MFTETEFGKDLANELILRYALADGIESPRVHAKLWKYIKISSVQLLANIEKEKKWPTISKRFIESLAQSASDKGEIKIISVMLCRKEYKLNIHDYIEFVEWVCKRKAKDHALSAHEINGQPAESEDWFHILINKEEAKNLSEWSEIKGEKKIEKAVVSLVSAIEKKDRLKYITSIIDQIEEVKKEFELGLLQRNITFADSVDSGKEGFTEYSSINFRGEFRRKELCDYLTHRRPPTYVVSISKIDFKISYEGAIYLRAFLDMLYKDTYDMHAEEILSRCIEKQTSQEKLSVKPIQIRVDNDFWNYVSSYPVIENNNAASSGTSLSAQQNGNLRAEQADISTGLSVRQNGKLKEKQTASHVVLRLKDIPDEEYGIDEIADLHNKIINGMDDVISKEQMDGLELLAMVLGRLTALKAECNKGFARFEISLQEYIAIEQDELKSIIQGNVDYECEYMPQILAGNGHALFKISFLNMEETNIFLSMQEIEKLIGFLSQQYKHKLPEVDNTSKVKQKHVDNIVSLSYLQDLHVCVLAGVRGKQASLANMLNNVEAESAPVYHEIIKEISESCADEHIFYLILSEMVVQMRKTQQKCEKVYAETGFLHKEFMQIKPEVIKSYLAEQESVSSTAKAHDLFKIRLVSDKEETNIFYSLNHIEEICKQLEAMNIGNKGELALKNWDKSDIQEIANRICKVEYLEDLHRSILSAHFATDKPWFVDFIKKMEKDGVNAQSIKEIIVNLTEKIEIELKSGNNITWENFKVRLINKEIKAISQEMDETKAVYKELMGKITSDSVHGYDVTDLQRQAGELEEMIRNNKEYAVQQLGAPSLEEYSKQAALQPLIKIQIYDLPKCVITENHPTHVYILQIGDKVYRLGFSYEGSNIFMAQARKWMAENNTQSLNGCRAIVSNIISSFGSVGSHCSGYINNKLGDEMVKIFIDEFKFIPGMMMPLINKFIILLDDIDKEMTQEARGEHPRFAEVFDLFTLLPEVDVDTTILMQAHGEMRNHEINRPIVFSRQPKENNPLINHLRDMYLNQAEKEKNRGNYLEAFSLYKSAAIYGRTDANFALGMMCMDRQIDEDRVLQGNPGSLDNMAAKSFKIASEFGHEDAGFFAAIIIYRLYSSQGYTEGLSIEEADDLMEAAAEKGNSRAKYNIALKLLNSAAEEDKARAYILLNEAESLGLRSASYPIGLCNLFGIGTDIDNELAVKKLNIAANNVEKEKAAYALAYHYSQDDSKDFTREQHWLEKASAAGNRSARILLLGQQISCDPGKTEELVGQILKIKDIDSVYYNFYKIALWCKHNLLSEKQSGVEISYFAEIDTYINEIDKIFEDGADDLLEEHKAALNYCKGILYKHKYSSDLDAENYLEAELAFLTAMRLGDNCACHELCSIYFDEPEKQSELEHILKEEIDRIKPSVCIDEAELLKAFYQYDGCEDLHDFDMLEFNYMAAVYAYNSKTGDEEKNFAPIISQFEKIAEKKPNSYILLADYYMQQGNSAKVKDNMLKYYRAVNKPLAKIWKVPIKPKLPTESIIYDPMASLEDYQPPHEFPISDREFGREELMHIKSAFARFMNSEEAKRYNGLHEQFIEGLGEGEEAEKLPQVIDKILTDRISIKFDITSADSYNAWVETLLFIKDILEEFNASEHGKSINGADLSYALLKHILEFNEDKMPYYKFNEGSIVGMIDAKLKSLDITEYRKHGFEECCFYKQQLFAPYTIKYAKKTIKYAKKTIHFSAAGRLMLIQVLQNILSKVSVIDADIFRFQKSLHKQMGLELGHDANKFKSYLNASPIKDDEGNLYKLRLDPLYKHITLDYNTETMRGEIYKVFDELGINHVQGRSTIVSQIRMTKTYGIKGDPTGKETDEYCLIVSNEIIYNKAFKACPVNPKDIYTPYKLSIGKHIYYFSCEGVMSVYKLLKKEEITKTPNLVQEKRIKFEVEDDRNERLYRALKENILSASSNALFAKAVLGIGKKIEIGIEKPKKTVLFFGELA